MAERIRWLVANRVIWVEPNPVTTTEDLKQDNGVIIKMIREAFSDTEMQVHVIINGSQLGSQPGPLDGRDALTYIGEPGMGYRVVAGIGNPMYYFFSKFVGTRKLGSTLIFPGIGQALRNLSQIDESLPNLIEIYKAQRDDNT